MDSILIAHGADRPGILDEVSDFLYQRHANIIDSKLLSMRGTFQLMILLSADESSIRRIRDEIGTLAVQSRITIDFRAASDPSTGKAGLGGTYRFTANGADQPGVLNKLSHLLRALNVNIDDVRTHVDAASRETGSRFDLELLLSVPRDTPVVKLREYLSTMCNDLAIAWELTPS